MAGQARIVRLIGAVNIGSFRISAIIVGITESGEMQVLGSGYRQSNGIKRGYVKDMDAATYAVRDALEKAEKMAGASVEKVWVGCSGVGLACDIRPVEISIDGRRIEEGDIELLLLEARKVLHADGRMVLHAQPACYFLDGAEGVANPEGLYAERFGVDIHLMLADSAPVRNVSEAVQRAHLEIEGVVAAPLAAGIACLSAEERDLGVAMVELGGELTNVAAYAGGMLVGLKAIERGSADITDAIASAFGIKRFQAERLKCKHGSAVASPADHREMVGVLGPNDDILHSSAGKADDRGQIPRAELIGVITGELDQLMNDIGRSLDAMGFSAAKGGRARSVVLTGGGAELPGFADYAQSVLGTPVRIGRPPPLKGLPEAHCAPGFATLAGLAMYAADDPIDIRQITSGYTAMTRPGPMASVMRVWRAAKEYF